MKQNLIYFSVAATCILGCKEAAMPIDREALLERNSPCVTTFDSLSSLSVGNGGFAVTVDASGLQTFPESYSKGVPLGTQSHWGWHSFANPEEYAFEETLKDYDFGHGQVEAYSVQFNEDGRNKDAANWYRVNPHRLHLGIIGLELPKGTTPEAFTDIQQKLVLKEGKINSTYNLNGKPVSVQTVCHPDRDMVSACVISTQLQPLKLRFPYPTGGHCDDACNWKANEKHTTSLVSKENNQAILKRVLDNTSYYVVLRWNGEGDLMEKEPNYFVLIPGQDTLMFSCEFLPNEPAGNLVLPEYNAVAEASVNHWAGFWNKGGIVDFSECTDARAKELERRVVLSQYLLAIQCAAETPPQETGLTYNSWFGKFHLEMIWWHQSHFPLWGHPELLDRTLNWYHKAEPVAAQIAKRQGFDGVRWMKMTDPSALEAPSKVGSFLIWQQPHFIHLAELVYRANPSDKVLENYYDLVQKTAEFMYSFASYDEANDRYVLKGVIPAQETLRASETVNPPMELSSWYYGLQTAQLWRERMGQKRIAEWDTLLEKLSPLAKNEENIYLAAETAPDSYTNIRYISDHPAVLGALGMYPKSRLLDEKVMRNTLDKVVSCWNWDETWGWDYPMLAMCAARVGEPDKAVDALLMNNRTNTCLVSGHNYQDGRLRLYLPGNGGLLTAIAVMCAGWDGCEVETPGFPKDGTWNVKWEGLLPMP